MTKDLPKELREARTLFEEFERSNSHSKKVRCFEDAIQILSDYIQENPCSSNLQFIENIRFSYTRRLLEQLKNIGNVEMDVWFDYLSLTIFKVENETNQILLENPMLRQKYEEFKALWKDEFVKLVNQ